MRNSNDSRVQMSLHRFHDTVGLSILGQDGETVYLEPSEVSQLITALVDLKQDMGLWRFSNSKTGTYTVGEE